MIDHLNDSYINDWSSHSIWLMRNRSVSHKILITLFFVWTTDLLNQFLMLDSSDFWTPMSITINTAPNGSCRHFSDGRNRVKSSLCHLSEDGDHVKPRSRWWEQHHVRIISSITVHPQEAWSAVPSFVLYHCTTNYLRNWIILRGFASAHQRRRDIYLVIWQLGIQEHKPGSSFFMETSVSMNDV